jgi:biopolymer transport protein ExbD
MKSNLKTKGRKFGAGGDPEPMMDINTTPLIDVMLVLLVMLIITIPIQLHAVNLEMPVGAPPTTIQPEKIQIDIDEKSVVYWQGLPVSAPELEQKMELVATVQPQPEVHIRPNKDCSYAVFANVLSSTKRKGLNKVAVIGHEQFVQ